MYTLKNVGICVPDPKQAFEVAGTALVKSQGGVPLTVTMRNTGTHIFNFKKSGSSALCVIPGGAVGIGTTSPTAMLAIHRFQNSVVPSFRYYALGGTGLLSATSVDISLYSTNRCVCTEYNATSDRREKAEIQPLHVDACTRLVKDLRPKSYYWKDFDDGLQFGFVSQDLLLAGHSNLVLPVPVEGESYLVEELDAHGEILSPHNVKLVLNYNHFIPYHHTVLNHLMKSFDTIDALNHTVSTLQARADAQYAWLQEQAS